MSHIGHVLRQFREAAHYSQLYIAAQLDVAESTVCRWETGDLTIDTRQLAEYCDAVGCRISSVVAQWERSKLRAVSNG